jgi:hemolysin III
MHSQASEPVVSIATGLPRPTWRGLIHAWAFWLCIPAVVALLVSAGTPDGKLGVAIYGASLAAVYGVSAAYHRLAITERAQQIMRRLDHSMIFVLIAGTYTPVCLLALPPSWWIPLLAVVWSLTAVGVVVKLWGTGWIMKASNALYLVLGWLALVALPMFLRTLAAPVLGLMVLGGVLYTLGAIVFYLQRPDPNPMIFGYHEIWHAFTVAAGVSHFVMVALVIA